ncbi:hypothetical protein ADIWIN_1453 [Winogradskyella psychrotolerans RS-3]|uniref:Uncharacterized protein n=1 Tax=Winogradskyella psychrotolerans RS-3 TaxID=641526 RepID=S7XBN6_9FLAO|nr:hypothetical protein [Winogradskyella psychrotolerans]EPR73423.1 hypothetical protein ADIWIN_1453 [Winogradskyella psychrotolerans RS-3]
MKQLSTIISKEFGAKIIEYNSNNSNANIYLQEAKNKINAPKHQLNKIIDRLNEYWAVYHEKWDAYSIEDNFLLLSILDDKDDDCTFFNVMTIDEFGLNVFFEVENLNKSNPFDHEFYYIPWKEVDQIEKIILEGELNLRFYIINSTNHIDVPINTFIPSNENFLINLFTTIIKSVQSVDIRVENDLRKKIESVNKLIDDEKDYTTALDLLEKLNLEENELGYKLEQYPSFQLQMHICLYELKRFDECVILIDNFDLNFEDDDYFKPLFLLSKAEILKNRGEYFHALQLLEQSEKLTKDASLILDLKSLKNEVTGKIENGFIQIPRQERKTILISNDIFRSANKSFIALNTNTVSSLNFPIGHPKLNEVYVVHPRRDDYYLPLHNTEEQLTLDRMSEYATLLQCLGATSFEVSSNKSKVKQEQSNTNTNTNVKVDVKIHGGEVNSQNQKSNDSFSDFDSKISQSQKYQPFKKPYIPDELVWYHSDINWQKLAKQRLEGNLLEHTEIVSVSQIENFSSEELKNINLDIKAFFVKVGVNYSKDIKADSKSNKKHTWTVTVKFEDVRNLSEQHIPKISEQNITIDQKNSINNPLVDKYKKDILFMLKNDNIIDEIERKILDRKAIKYNISKNDANEIERNVFKSIYTDNELEYIEQLQDILIDGSIEEDEKLILSRYANEYGLTEERSQAINDIFIK